MTAMSAPSLQWVSTIFNRFEPRWALEPDMDVIAQIAREQLHLQADAPLTCSFFAQGGFNKLYALETDSGRYLMRVALPVEPRHKTLSEVATLTFVRGNCTPLVPNVLAYDAEPGDDNRLGLEWLLMARMPGIPAADAWPGMSWQAKEQLVRDVVGVLAVMHEHSFEGIGNLYNGVGGFEVGRIVSMNFFWRQFRELQVSRGPFRTSQEYLAARIALKLGAAECTLRDPDDSDDEEEATAVKSLALRLQALLPTIFPATAESAERTVLHHDDLSWHNILVSADRLSGIVDWECVSTMPWWKACQLPHFLVGSARPDPPDRSTYAVDPDTGTVNQLFDEHQREHDQTRLRVVFWEEMARASPNWVEHARAVSVQADFAVAVDECDNEWQRRKVAAWLDAVEASSPYSLFEQIYFLHFISSSSQ